jgi:hypothetical protein
MIYLIPLAVFFLVVLVFIIIYKRKKPIYIGLGTSGLNVAKAFQLIFVEPHQFYFQADLFVRIVHKEFFII